MTIPLTVETLAAAYDYLRTTPPFNKWNLPEAEDVKFTVGRMIGDYAQYQWDGKQHTVTISRHAIGHTDTLLQKLGHEAIHMHLEQTNMESRRGGNDTHNAAFRKFAAAACKFHGWDPKAFF